MHSLWRNILPNIYDGALSENRYQLSAPSRMFDRALQSPLECKRDNNFEGREKKSLTLKYLFTLNITLSTQVAQVSLTNINR